MARERRFPPLLLAALVIGAVWWSWDLAVLRAGVPHPLDDHWEDQIVAEHLIAREPFRTRMLYPPLWPFHDPETRTIPVLVHGPLLPLLTVLPVRFLSRETLDGLAWPIALFALLTVIPLYRLGARHFGPPVGFAAAFLYTCSPLTLEAVHHSGSVIIGSFFVAWAVFLVARPRPRALAAGLALGLGYLVRPELLLLLPLILAFSAWQAVVTRANQRLFEGPRPRIDAFAPDHEGRRPDLPPPPEPGIPASPLGAAAALIAGFVVCAAPWWWHHLRAVGNPFYNLTAYTVIGYWGDYPGPSVLQDFALTPDRWPEVFRAHLPGLLPKWLSFAPRAAKHLLCTPSGATGWLAVLGLIASFAGAGALLAAGGVPLDPRRIGERRRLALLGIAMMLIPAASMTLTQHQRLYVVPFSTMLALAAAVGAAALARWMPEWGRRPRLWIGALILATIPVAIPAARSAGQEARLLEARLVAERGALAEAFGPRIAPARPGVNPVSPPPVLFSDSPDFVAWTTGRPTFWCSRETYAKLYPEDGSAGLAPRFGLPPRNEVDGWFHDDVRDPTATGARVSPAPPRTHVKGVKPARR